MKVFRYSRDNGQFIGEEDACENPEEKGNFLIPAFTTTIAPPAVKTGEVAGFSGGGWTIRKLNPLRTPTEARAAKLLEIKARAFNILYPEDYLVQRHLEQLALGGETSLSEEAYQVLLVKRQAIREKSNTYEATLAKMPNNAGKIDALEISY